MKLSRILQYRKINNMTGNNKLKSILLYGITIIYIAICYYVHDGNFISTLIEFGCIYVASMLVAILCLIVACVLDIAKPENLKKLSIFILIIFILSALVMAVRSNIYKTGSDYGYISAEEFYSEIKFTNFRHTYPNRWPSTLDNKSNAVNFGSDVRTLNRFVAQSNTFSGNHESHGRGLGNKWLGSHVQATGGKNHE